MGRSDEDTRHCHSGVKSDMRTKEPGGMVIKHWEGDLIYEIQEAKYKVVDERLVIQVCCAEPRPGHPMEALGEPVMTIGFPCPGGFESLRGKTVKVSSYEPDRAGGPEYVNFYLSRHHECHGTEVSISLDGSFRILTKCEDVNYYDGRAKDNWIEVQGSELRCSEQVYDVY